MYFFITHLVSKDGCWKIPTIKDIPPVLEFTLFIYRYGTKRIGRLSWQSNNQ